MEYYGKGKMMMAMKALAEAEGSTISDAGMDLIKLVSDLTDEAYTAGYEQGFDDGKAVGRGDDNDR